jgi:hypothetical protein
MLITLQPMNDELAAIAAAQGGPFTRAQAVRCGYTDGGIRGMRKREWIDLYRGVYVQRALLQALPPGSSERHVLQTAGRILGSHLGVVASHRTGALVHELPLLGRPPAVPQVTQSPRCLGDTSRSPGLYVATLSEEDRTTSAGGVPVTSLARTACDVARKNPFRDGVVVADAVLGRLVPAEDLLAVARRCAGWPGGGRALTVARFADGRSDGPLESITRVAYQEEGLPAPETQVEVWSPEGLFLGLVDFLFREQRVIGEADGMGKYDRDGALRDEKRREMGLSRCGFQVVRNTWGEVWQAAGRRDLGHRMRQAFALSARIPAVPGVTFRTPTLEQLVARRTETRPCRSCSLSAR